MSRFLEVRDIWILTRTFPLLLQDSIFKQKADWYEENHFFRCIYCKSTRRKRHSCPIKWDFGDYLTEQQRTWSDQLALEFFERKIWGQEITDSVIRNFYILKSLYKSFYRFKEAILRPKSCRVGLCLLVFLCLLLCLLYTSPMFHFA